MPIENAQPAFATGEWAPKLRSRVDIQRYRTGAALMRNFYVDYAGGGASTRPGTEFINQCKSAGARLIGFQPSVSISYELEFGQNYIRFYSNGAPILETAVAIQSITPGSPATVNSTANGYANGDWVFISNAYYIVTNAATNTYQLTDLFGNPVNALTGTQAQRVYTIASPYATSDLFPNQATGNPGIKFAQDVTSLIITHPSYAPYILTINSATNWTLTAITFGPTISAPTGLAFAANITGTGWFYSYIVTAVDNNGQESVPSASIANAGGGVGNIVLVNPSNLSVSWTAVPGAVSYNIYKAAPQSTIAVPTGAQYGFVGNVTSAIWRESFPGVAPDFSQTPPLVASPIVGGTVTAIILTGSGSTFSFVPTVSIAAAPAGGLTATAQASLKVVGFSPTGAQQVAGNPSGGYVGQSPVGLIFTYVNGITAQITSATFTGSPSPTTWTINSLTMLNPGSITGVGTGAPAGSGATSINSSAFAIGTTFVNFNWGVGAVTLIQGGFGYTSAPAVTFTPGGGAAAHTTVSPINNTGSGVLGAAPVGNPRCVEFFQERMCLASPNAGLQSFYMSQPGSFFNFNVSNPSQADDGIFGSIIGTELNDIRSLVSVPTGLLALTGKGAWLINGGGGISTSSPITSSNVAATSQAFNGANDLRPLRTNLDLLYVTNKGNYVRDQTYNIYANIFTGQDITYLSNHLFFGYQIADWCWAEEPFKVAWAVRSDGNLLSLTYLKDQELIGWAHHDTNGFFTSCCSVIETVNGNTTDAVYFIIQRVVQGQTVSYVERMADRYFPYGCEDSWSVDCGLQTSPVASPTSTLSISGSANTVGSLVTLADTVGQPFTLGMVGNVVRAGGGIYEITTFTNAGQVSATVTRVPAQLNHYNDLAFPVTGYTIWQPVSSISGLTQLIGQSVVGVADGIAVGPLTVSATGSVTLSTPASKVTLGLQFLPQLQTLPLDLGGQKEIQGKRLKIVAVTLRVADTLGLQIGSSFETLTTMKDLQLGAIPSTSTGAVRVTDLVNSSYNIVDGDDQEQYFDARTVIDQVWQEAGSYCIQQNLPYPATVLGAFPELQIGDIP